MMDYDERIDYQGEMVRLDDLTNDQVCEILRDLRDTKPINTAHEHYLSTMIDHLDDELIERGFTVPANVEGYYFDDGYGVR